MLKRFLERKYKMSEDFEEKLDTKTEIEELHFSYFYWSIYLYGKSRWYR